MTNEFEEMYNTDDFEESSDDAVGQQTASEQGSEDDMVEEGSSDELTQDDIIDSGSQSLKYDYNKAPDRAKGMEREELDGKTVTIEEAEIILPPPEKEWEWSKQKTVQQKPCMFVVHYENGQREYYSGVKVFKRDKNGSDKYSHPQIHNKGDNQASKLKRVYAKFKGVEPEEISLKQFMSFLNSKPKALIKTEEVKNPESGKVVRKNFISEFVSDK